MSKLIENIYFEPTSSTKELWLFGHKERRKYPLSGHDDYFPGIFDSKKFNRSKNAFLFSVVVEIITMIILWNYVPSPFILLLPFFLDVVIAYLAQWFEKLICEFNNKALLAKEGIVNDEDLQKDALSRIYLKKSNTNRTFKRLLHLLLLLILIGKATLIFIYMPGNTWFKFTVFILNLLACLIHINNTGDYLHGFRLRNNLKREFKKFKDFKDNEFKIAFHRRTLIPGKTLKLMPESDSFKHKIINYQDGQNLCTWGILEDEDLNDMIETQDTDEQKRLLALYGLYAQLFQILPSDTLKADTVVDPHSAQNS